jgi:hypothetical protein
MEEKKRKNSVNELSGLTSSDYKVAMEDAEMAAVIDRLLQEIPYHQGFAPSELSSIK